MDMKASAAGLMDRVHSLLTQHKVNHQRIRYVQTGFTRHTMRRHPNQPKVDVPVYRDMGPRLQFEGSKYIPKTIFQRRGNC